MTDADYVLVMEDLRTMGNTTRLTLQLTLFEADLRTMGNTTRLTSQLHKRLPMFCQRSKDADNSVLRERIGTEIDWDSLCIN